MAYIPKNRYKIRYTNGYQYRLANSTKEYVGSYIKLSDGKVFAGNDINNIIGALLPLYISTNNNVLLDHPNNRTYAGLKPELTLEQDKYLSLKSAQPFPTEEDYKKGFFFRYLSVKVNTKTYKEISENTYKNFSRRDYNKKLYKVFKIRWSIKENNLKDNTDSLKRLDSKLPGIFDFFPNKAQYKSRKSFNNITEDLIAKPNELFFLDGRPYPAGEKYHIHPTKGPMVGAKHVPEVHAFLTFNRFEPQTSNQESPTTTSTLESGY